MCGICGQISTESSRPIDRQILSQMNRTLIHRGPDSEGLYVAGNAGLAMRRLSIIDVAGGDQPISNEDESIWIVFNGEIYNYPEIRKQLESRGHAFKSKTDTECVVHLYEDHGPLCVNHLRGMFAFALWDEKRRLLLLARDRVGKKPLYYALYDGRLLFASEIKAILQYPGFPRRVDWEAIHHYLTLQYVPDPWSAFRGIQKLPPAHRLVAENGHIRVESYWDLSYEPKLKLPEKELYHMVRHVVTDAVRVRLMSEVPLGAHLSGGIDSTVVVGLMAGILDSPVKTFSIGFKEKAFSELPYARNVARKFGTEHREFVVEPKALDILPKLLRHFDEPFADPAAIPTWYLAMMTRPHVTVALNGDGGDEAFAGYQRYYADTIADAYRLIPRYVRHHILDNLLHALPVQTNRPMERSYLMGIRQLAAAADLSRGASVVRWSAYFTEAQKRELYQQDLWSTMRGTESAQLLTETFRRAGAKSCLDRTLYTDLHNYLPGALLPKVDRTTMAHSLEARSPFLDQSVLELAAQLPAKWKVRGTRTKRILVDVFRDLLPPEVIQRGKTGFEVPLTLWFAGPLCDSAKEALLGADSHIVQVFHSDFIAKLIDDNMKGRSDNGKRIWTLLNLEEWLRQYRAML